MSSPSLTGAEAARYELMRELGIRCDEAFALREQLDADFSVADRGFPQLADITDERDRAIASDLIASSMRAVVENLLEARLHQDRVTATLQGGVRHPRASSIQADLQRGAEIDMDIAGWGRALCSALDCLAAVAIGILRVPLSIQRAALSHLNNLPDLMSKATGSQQRVWQDLVDLLDRHKGTYPTGWFDWLIATRNLQIHRARQVRIFLARPDDTDSPKLAVPIELLAELRVESVTFDLFLRRRPEVCDMQDLIEVTRAQDLWINEPAGTTLPGVFLVTNDLTEEFSRFLLEQWRAIGGPSGDFPAPLSKWELPPGLPDGFEGVAPRGDEFAPSGSQIRGNPALATRLELAEALSQRGQRLPGT